MSSEPSTRSATQTGSTPPEDRVRLKLKPRSGSTSGFVDGGWWPRSRDLSAELSDLLAVLAIRLGPVERVSYRLSDWEPAVRRIVVDGGLVHLVGYRGRPVSTVDVIAAKDRVTLLVVPPGAAAGAAHRALQASGHRDNADAVADLLAPHDGEPARASASENGAPV
jgi:hypothetical protein